MNATIPELIEKHLNATLTAGEAAALAQAMAENPALAEEFAAATRLEAALSDSMKDKERTALYTRRMERAAAETEPARSRRPWPVKSLAAAAGIAALIGIGWRLMEGEPAGKLLVKRGPAASTPGNTDEVNSHSPSGGIRIADASSMKRKLRRFASTTNRLHNVPVSQALAALQSEWAGYAHGNTKDKDAVFTVADAARQKWPKPEDEPTVSLEIPGISLLTSLELIAAQASLKATVTADGVSLDPETRRDDGKPRKWTIPLSLASVSTFMNEVSSGSAGIASNSASNYYTWGRLMSPLMVNDTRPSWMEVPEFAQTTGRQFWYDIDYAAPVLPDLALATVSTDNVVSVRTSDMAIDAEAIEILRNTNLQGQATAEAVLHEYSNPFPSPETAQLNADGTLSFPGLSFPITPSVPLTFSEDGYTIDLNLAPEVVDFSGFINYGEPIQTTGINALGQSEPVILTDSGITQPVFATRVLPDHGANLTRLLAAHGVPAAGATWDQESGVVTARGSFSQLRAAQAAAAAIQEAASAGVTVEMKVIQWKDGVPTAAADPSGLLPPPASGRSETLSAEGAAALVRHPEAAGTLVSKGIGHMGKPFTFWSAQSYDPGVTANVNGITRNGFTSHLPVKIRLEDKTISGIARSRGEIESGGSQFDVQLQDGEWLRTDFPARDNERAVTVLLGVQSATLP